MNQLNNQKSIFDDVEVEHEDGERTIVSQVRKSEMDGVVTNEQALVDGEKPVEKDAREDGLARIDANGELGVKSAEKKSTEEKLTWQNLRIKNDIVRWERNNFDKIAFYYTGNGFWQTTLNSSLFMVNLVHDQLGLKSKIHSTLDYYLKTERLFTSYNSNQMERMPNDLKGLGMKLLRSDKSIMVFEMVAPVPVEMIRDWARVEEIRRRKLEAYYAQDAVRPELYAKVRELGHYTIAATERMRASAQVYATQLAGYLEEMYRLCRHAEEKTEQEMLEVLGRFSYLVQILNDDKLIEDKKAQRIGVLMFELRRLMVVGKKKDPKVKGK